MSDPMAEIRASFFIECEELLEAMQDGLEELDSGESDIETINVVFRAVHSIKGGAGAFGLEALVRFAHRYETVMDIIRSGSLSIDADLMKLFFRAADHLSDLVRICRDEGELPTEVSEALVKELNVYIGEEEEEEAEEDIEFQPMGLAINLDLDEPDMALDLAKPGFKIHFAPDAELFETGNEPAMVLKALKELGECEVTCNTDKLPELSSLAPETPYLSWDVELTTDAERAEVMSVFEFVDGLCTLDIEQVAGVADIPPLDEVPETVDDDEEEESEAPAPATPETLLEPVATETPPAPVAEKKL